MKGATAEAARSRAGHLAIQAKGATESVTATEKLLDTQKFNPKGLRSPRPFFAMGPDIHPTSF